MAWINTVDPDHAEDRLEELYEDVSIPNGEVPNVLKTLSLNEEGLGAVGALFETLMFGDSPLSRAQREMIAVRVSTLNDCEY